MEPATLKFTGRLTKDEVIFLGRRQLLKRPSSIFFALLSLIIATVFYYLPENKCDACQKWIFVFIFGYIGLKNLFRYTLGFIRLYTRSVAQEVDTTIEFSTEKFVMQYPDGIHASFPAKLISVVESECGLIGMHDGSTLFLLPYREISQDQKSSILKMYNPNASKR